VAATSTGVGGAVRPGKVPYTAVLRNKRFRMLWLSQFVSGLGDWLVVGLLIPLVTTLSGGSAFAVAGIMIAKIIPSLLFSSVIGALVDHFDRRRLMIACDIIRALLTLLLLTTNSLAVIYLVVLLMEIASLFFSPARNALIPDLVADHEVAVANGLAYTTQQASMLIGLTMSGGILAGFEALVRWFLESGFPLVDVFVGPFAPALLGPRAGVILNSLTFVASALFLRRIKVDARARRDATGRFQFSLIGKDMLESFRFMGEHREFRGLLITIATAILGGGSIITVGLAYVQDILARGVPILEQFEAIQRLVAAPQTFVLVLMAVGMAAGAVIAPKIADRVSLQLLFLGAVAVFGVGMFVFASVSVYWVSLLFAITAGFCIASLTVAGNTYVARTVTGELRGRVFTAMESVIRVSLLLSMVVVAPLADLLAALIGGLSEGMADPSWFSGPRVTLQLASLIVLGAAYYAYRTLDWRTSTAGDEERTIADE
jgi:dTMP kinase